MSLALAEQLDRNELDAICRRHRVRKLWLFGSQARGEGRPDSDVDLLVDYESGFVPTYLELAGLVEELRSVFGDRSIDIARPKQLHWYIRDQVLSEAREIYAR